MNIKKLKKSILNFWRIIRFDHFYILRPFRSSIYRILYLNNRILIRILDLKLINFQRIEIPASQVPQRYLFLSRSFKQSNEPHIINLVNNFKRVTDGEIIHKAKIGSTIFGNVKWSRRIITSVKPGHVFFVDPQLVGLPGIFGLISILKLKKLSKLNKFNITLVLFDIHDPQGSFFAFIIAKMGFEIKLICSTPTEARKFFKIVNSSGPIPEAVIKSIGGFNAFDIRNIDLHLPRPSYEPRKSIVENLQRKIQKYNLGITYTVGGSFSDHESLQSSLKLTKIIVVTNQVVLEANGNFPIPSGPLTHMVSYNAEALSAGALLISQRCQALEEILIPFVEYIPFNDEDDLFYLINRFYNNPIASEIAFRGHIKFKSLWENQLLLKKE